MTQTVATRIEVEASIVNLPVVLTVNDVAHYLQRSTKTVYRRIQSGQIRSYKEGHDHRIRREWLLEYERGLVSQGADQPCTP